MENIKAEIFSRLLSLHNKQAYLSGIGSVTLSDLSQKDANSSVEARKKGNQMYTQKDNHDRHVHRDILSHYTESVAFAPINSEELALAYSNRSVLLLHLQRYEECLIDIGKSTQIAKSDVLKAKLETRKGKCLELMRNSSQVSMVKVSSNRNKTGKNNLPPKKSNELLEFYKMTPSPHMPAASEAISASYNETFGRHFVATRDINAGEVILVERGFACLPKNSEKYLVCNHCLKFAWNGIPCNNCAVGVYCSVECKNEAWEEYHEVECSLLPFMSFVMYEEEGLMNALIMAVRMLVKAIRKEGFDTILMEAKANRKGLEGMTADGIMYKDQFKAFYSLLSHRKSIRKMLQRQKLNEPKVIQLLSKHTSIFDAAKHSSDGTIEPKVMLQLERILGKIIDIISVNAFAYQAPHCECGKSQGESDITECDSNSDSSKGIIFSTCASLINHSCAPNVSRMSLPKGKIAFFTFTPVKKGDQLYDSYGPTVTEMPNRKSRKEYLKEQFFFNCNCISCEEDWYGDEEVEFKMNHKVEDAIHVKIMDQFKKSFPHAMESSLFAAEAKDWEFDEEQLKMALKMTNLYYKYYYKIPLVAFTHSLPFRMYIDIAFNRLFGENAIVPKNCFSI